jgi:hypothetical protein
VGCSIPRANTAEKQAYARLLGAALLDEADTLTAGRCRPADRRRLPRRPADRRPRRLALHPGPVARRARASRKQKSKSLSGTVVCLRLSGPRFPVTLPKRRPAA